MTLLDRFLQRWRIAKARRFLAPGMRVLDVGSADAVLLRQFSNVGAGSVGIDPRIGQPAEYARFRLVQGFFPQDLPPSVGPFDAITMLAVLEHFPESSYAHVTEACRRFLKPGGLVIITVPCAKVDDILVVLKALRLVKAATLDEHHGYKVEWTHAIFAPPDFDLVCHKGFQLGLNNLFVFRRR